MLCSVDNDLDFNFNQDRAGAIRGSIHDILRECEQRAIAMHGTHSSSGIKSVKLVSPRSHLSLAVCHVDDDPDFNFDQIVVGELAGRNIIDLKDQCRLIAKKVFGSKGSFGLKF